MLQFREIAHSSDDYRHACRLRQEVLRAPLGLSLDEEELALEANQLHFGLFEGDELQACVVAKPISPSEVKLRQMAVVRHTQGRGHGRKLIESLERELFQRGYRNVRLHARVPAAGFYRKLGYRQVGQEFEEVGIAHVLMQKSLR
ncbi:putative acetyltransferase [Posidoniimonas polymericola]|uniref:Putative acetyltransferase n=1 Tax=Posidoniimonas polymericola TaxID=2528002 RepID=A0A5C5ZFF2_9BACT|nr:GNAT family N-acetyltransferase [Posidoniimonas polymericola]TWT85571.1 putative acetyltransferase [Posidoniimonas polymericola]